MRRRSAGGSARPTGSPSIRTSPRSGSTSRLMHLSSVVLPDPDPPTSAANAPAFTLTCASRTAKLCPPSNDLLNRSISISAPGMRLGSHAHSIWINASVAAFVFPPVRRPAGQAEAVFGQALNANVNISKAALLDEQGPRWQRRRIETEMLHDARITSSPHVPLRFAAREPDR